MNDRFFVDTNILVYAHDRSAGLKHRRASLLLEQLWQSGAGVISTQVLQEFCVSLRRKSQRPLSLEELRDIVQDYLKWEVVVNGPEAIVAALEFEGRYRVSFWDALILQAAETAGASVLYSEDLASGQFYRAVQVIDPFAKT
jgi:predicted nucleic acid-binding protein